MAIDPTPITNNQLLVRRYDLFKVILRSFCIQGLWNFKGMQNVGFLYTIIPALKRIYPEKDRYKESLLRHLVFFNTQPYLANFIIGVTLAKEEEYSRKREVSIIHQISALKEGMSGPLAALGDSLFWAGIRPLFALLGTILLLSTGYIWGTIVFLLLYNLIHIPVRFLGIIWGYREKEKIIERIKGFRTQGLLRTKDTGGVVVSCLGIVAFFDLWPFLEYLYSPWIRLVTISISLLIMGLFSFAIHKGISPSRLFFILISLSLILASL